MTTDWQLNVDSDYQIRFRTFAREQAMILEPVIIEYKRLEWVLFFLKMFLTFQVRGLYHFELFCTLTIEA